jgi:hypothetical protein
MLIDCWDFCLEKQRLSWFRLIKTAEKIWRHLDGKNQLPKVITGVKFCEGYEVIATDERAAA